MIQTYNLGFYKNNFKYWCINCLHFKLDCFDFIYRVLIKYQPFFLVPYENIKMVKIILNNYFYVNKSINYLLQLVNFVYYK